MTTTRSSPSVPGRAIVSKTRRAVGLALRDGPARTLAGAVTVGYLLVYLVAIGHLVPGRGTVGLTVVADPAARLLDQVSLLSFEPVALVDLAVVRLLVAPGNVVLGLVIGGLVGLNLALAFLAWRRPACGVERSGGALAGVPALLSGAACCGPTLLFVLGLQATGALVAAVAWLVPLSVVLLLSGLVLAARSVPA